MNSPIVAAAEFLDRLDRSISNNLFYRLAVMGSSPSEQERIDEEADDFQEEFLRVYDPDDIRPEDHRARALSLRAFIDAEFFHWTNPETQRANLARADGAEHEDFIKEQAAARYAEFERMKPEWEKVRDGEMSLAAIWEYERLNRREGTSAG